MTREEKLAYNKEYAKKNAERLRERRLLLYSQDPEKYRERSRVWKVSEGGKIATGKYRTRYRERYGPTRVAKYKVDPLKELVKAAKQRAAKSGQEFDMEQSDISLPATCPILGIPICVGAGSSHDGSPSIDRFDNAKGYVKGNVWVISKLANTMKSSASPELLRAFGAWATKTYGSSPI